MHTYQVSNANRDDTICGMGGDDLLVGDRPMPYPAQHDVIE
jgi:hypothetical protein